MRPFLMLLEVVLLFVPPLIFVAVGGPLALITYAITNSAVVGIVAGIICGWIAALVLSPMFPISWAVIVVSWIGSVGVRTRST